MNTDIAETPKPSTGGSSSTGESLEIQVKEFEHLGCSRQDRVLGFGKMPEGYALMLDSDDMYFFWVSSRGEQGPIDWNKWRVRRGAIAREKRLAEQEAEPALTEGATDGAK